MIETRQQAFDFAVAHMLKQRCKSVNTYSGKYHECKYRGENGNMCIIGAMINDSEYDESLEGQNVYSGDVCKALRNSGVKLNLPFKYGGTPDVEFLLNLQDVHDDWLSGLMESLYEKFDKFAFRYGLSTEFLESKAGEFV